MNRCERKSGTERCAEPAQWLTESGSFYCDEHASCVLREDEPVPDTERAPVEARTQ